MHLRSLLAGLTAIGALAAPAAARAADLPEVPGADWTQATITEQDGTRLHADVLRPKGTTGRTPVILSIGPYFNHTGQVGAAAPVEGEAYDPAKTTPSDRFYDFINGAKLMEKGYSWVQVDLRGFGGSTGCLDWGGPGEQADVKAAIEWAASQAFSSGKVGMYGKSYDGVTGIIGAESGAKGLAAVVSQEPVYDLYRYLYANGVRYTNAAGTPALYDAIAYTPGSPLEPGYFADSLSSDVSSPGCAATNYLPQATDNDHASAYWRQRDFIKKAKQVDVPFFLTQGFLENNTKPDGAFAFFNDLRGPKRAWFGMWDHVRGNDMTTAGRLAMGRKGWFDETMRFFDEHLKGIKPAVADPPVAVQTSDGSWRAEDSWPPADADRLTTQLRTGTYADNGSTVGTGDVPDTGVWTISKPLASPGHLAGVPTAKVALTSGGLPGANVAVDVYDIDAANKATLVSRQTALLPAGKSTKDLELYGDDWLFPAGHRVGVLVTGTNSEWWLPVPTTQDVTIDQASIQLPFLRYDRAGTGIEGVGSIRLEEWLEEAPFTLPAATIAQGEKADFAVPAPLAPRPVAVTGTASPSSTPTSTATLGGRRLSVRLTGRQGRKLLVRGIAPAGKVRVTVLRAGRAAARRTVAVKGGRYRVVLAVRTGGRYRAQVASLTAARRATGLQVTSKALRLR